MRKDCIVVTAWLVFSAVQLHCSSSRAGEAKGKRVPPAPLSRFEIRNIEGWSVYINKQDLAEHRREMDGALEHLQKQFYQIRLVVPAPAVAIMQQRVPLWVEYEAGPGLSFHPSYRWLLDRGHPCPEGLRSLVSNCHAKSFCEIALHQPWVVLHELAHGYDYLYLGRSRQYSNGRIRAVFNRAKESGSYDAVLCRYSDSTRHYAMSNEMEYLAENTEAYFGTNDFYPFVRAELEEHDPAGYVLLQKLWGVDARRQRRLARSLAKFMDSQPGRPAGKSRRRNMAPVPTSEYERRQVQGWTVYVAPELVDRKAYGDEICKLLDYKLHLIKRYMPDKAAEQLRTVPIWVEMNDPAVPYMAYHHCEKQIEAARLNRDKLNAVEIGNAARFEQWQNLQQFMLLNQLARAYYHRFLNDRVGDIKKAWEKAVNSGKYDTVLRFDGKRVRHPALAGPVEFFAEMTESYYGVNDHYPFLQFETRRHDPQTCALLAELWGAKAK